jgi:hypothetical protein
MVTSTNLESKLNPSKERSKKFPYIANNYPDESFQSIIARSLNHIQAPNAKVAIFNLLGTSGVSTLNFLPSHLDQLISVLPAGHNYSIDRLIENHTPLPFFAPFQPIEREKLLREDMQGTDGLKAYLRSGLTSGYVPLPAFLRFCPICIRQDREQFGERYWHRLHQLPGVEVCPNHRVFLENSTIRAQSRRVRYEIISAEETVLEADVRLIDPSNSSQQHLLKIAQDAEWLLNHPNLLPGLDVIRGRYLKLLIQRDLANYQGIVRTRQLLEAFHDYYLPEFLKSLYSEIRGSSNWLFRLVRSPKHSQHPLHHLLLIHFLGHRVETFMNLSSDLYPFGAGPWLCLNSVCEYYEQPCIQQYDLKHDKVHGNRLTATFQCDYCGFTYSRMGPNTSDDDRFKVGKIKARGHVWESVLKELWEDPSLTLKEMADRLGADSQSVKYHAARLGLTYPRLGPTAKHLQKTVAPAESREVKASEPAKLSTYRDEWLKILAENPEVGRAKLADRYRRVHGWLSFYDSDWLSTNLPPFEQRHQISSFIDWHERDAVISNALRASAEKIQNSSKKPQQITKTALGSDCGYLVFIQKHLDRLSLTAEVLTELSETTEQFALRRITWVTEQFREEGQIPKYWQIVRQANLKPYIAAIPVVNEAIFTALSSFASDDNP